MVICIAAIVLVSFRAAEEWQRTAAALAQHRAEAMVNVLVGALMQDMRGVQTTVLSDQQPDVTESAPAIRYDLIASAFARYPYPDAFFTWTAGQLSGLLFYTRGDRPPAWLPPHSTPPGLPVETTVDAAIGDRLLTRISIDARIGRRYSTFDIVLRGSRLQVVALLSYDDAYRQDLKGAFGFLVDLAWVREHYFADVARHVMPIGSNEYDIRLAVENSSGEAVFRSKADAAAAAGYRELPLLFFDPRLVAVDWPPDLHRAVWTAHARIDADPLVLAASAGARRSLLVAALLAGALVLAFAFVLRAARASAQLADMRSEFMATVTHELKTPLATIHAISETFASGRGMTPEISRKYGRFSVHEAKRLRRLIDNLLAYARITDPVDMYTFEAVAPSELIEIALRDFASQLEYGGFDVRVEVPPTLPLVRADRRALSLVLVNLVDNAIRYSGAHKYVEIRASNGGDTVVLAVTDHGVGIPDDEIPFVRRKFFIGQRGGPGGTGLGLAIVDRIVVDHGGSLSISSAIGQGTTVRLELPTARG